MVPQQTSSGQIKITFQREYLSFFNITYQVIPVGNDEKSIYNNEY